MITKILEIRYCIECPHCNGYFQCAKLERAVDEIPEDCPLPAMRDEERDGDRIDFLEQQTRKSPTGISLQWMPAHREPAGIRFMRRGKIYEQKRTVREALDVAIKDCWK